MYVLPLRFNPDERSKPLHKDFEWLTKREGKLFATMDLLKTTEASNKSLAIFNLANGIVKEL